MSPVNNNETNWQTEKLLYDGDAFFEALFKDIENAHVSVDFETYIFRDDLIGKRLVSALERTAARGVKVRLIVDGMGASGWFEKNAPLLELKGVAVRIYHPVLFFNLWSRLKIDLGLDRPKIKIRGSAVISRLNRRDHRKMCIIDNRIGYVGSVNVTAEHCLSIVGDRAWRDTSARVEEGPVPEMSVAFDDVWDRCHDAKAQPRWKERLTRTKSAYLFSRLLRFNHSSKLRNATFRALIKKISGARERVYITNPYFAPPRVLVRALKRASQNGADVRVLVPRNSDVFFMPWVATAYYAVVLKGGGRIFEYLPRILHAKTAVIDDWVIVGSSNFNRRSLVHDFEVDIVLAQDASRIELINTFHRDLKEAEEVQQCRGGLTSWVGRLISVVLKNWI